MVDIAASIAQNPAAPAEERYDATAEFAKSDGVLQKALQLDIAPAIDHIREVLADQDMLKSARGNLIVGPWKKPAAKRGGQSVFLDDFQLQTQGEYWDRPGILGFESMRSMVDATPILNGIVLTRIRQVARFCRPQTDLSSTGFVIEHRDRTIDLTDEQKTATQLLQKFIENGGWEFDPRRRKRLKRDTFMQFMAKSVRDALTMDAAPIETEFKRDRNLGLDGFYALDGASIRLCTEQGYQGDDEIYAVQVIQGQIRTAYTYDDLVYEVRNPRTDVTACGYGYSETEMLVRVVTYLLNTMTYNGSFFDKNSIPRGLLNVYGNFDQKDLAVFKRQWNAMVRGISNAHSLPVMVSKDQESGADYTEIGNQLSEMAFGKWLSFLTSVACAIYGCAPEEISMESYTSGKAPLSGSDTEEKLVSANDKGLQPLLDYYEGVFTDFIIRPCAEDYVLSFKGLDADDKKTRNERQKLSLTWNEIRSQDGLEPIDGPLGDMPINNALIPTWQAYTGIGQPEPDEEDFGDPDEGDDAPFGGEKPGDEDDDEGAAAQPDEERDGAKDFGRGEEMAKAMTADFGLPPIYSFEG